VIDATRDLLAAARGDDVIVTEHER